MVVLKVSWCGITHLRLGPFQQPAVQPLQAGQRDVGGLGGGGLGERDEGEGPAGVQQPERVLRGPRTPITRR